MVVLVRCFDDTFTLALESRIAQLKKEGLISAFLRNGNWIKVGPHKGRISSHGRARLTATVVAV